MITLLIGHPRTAVAILDEGAGLLAGADIGFLRPTHAHLAMAHALVGDLAAAERNERAADAANRSLDGVFAVNVMRSSAWVRAGHQPSLAVHAAQAAAERAASQGQWAYEALAQHDVARFGQAASVADRLEHLSTMVDGALMAAFAAHAQALRCGNGPALDRVSQSFDDLRCDLFAAEASAAAASCHRQAGKNGSAYASAERARELAIRCEGACTPAFGAMDDPGGLTGREREIATLAARGLPSREIARRLDISIRTVDNILGRVYSKLGIAGRDELTDLLGRRTTR